MAKKKKAKPNSRELRRRNKIRAGLRRYHNDVRAVKKATGSSWRDAQKLIPPGVRRPGGKGRRHRADLVDVARERYAVSRETESIFIPPGDEAPESIDGKTVEITYVDLLEYLIQAAREEGPVEIATEFYELDREVLEQGPRASEIYREFGLAGDRFYAPGEKKRQASDREWRLGQRFMVTFGKKGWLLTQ